MLRHQPAARGLSAHGPLAFRSKPSLVARRGQDVEILKISGDRLLRDANRRWMHWGLAVVAPLAIRGRHVASPCAISSALRHVVTPVRVSWRAMLRFDFWIRASGFGRDNWAGRSPVFPYARRCISQAFLMCDRNADRGFIPPCLQTHRLVPMVAALQCASRPGDHLGAALTSVGRRPPAHRRAPR
jgi:hypothetical protein